jgi:hypothetical protein
MIEERKVEKANWVAFPLSHRLSSIHRGNHRDVVLLQLLYQKLVSNRVVCRLDQLLIYLLPRWTNLQQSGHWLY